MALATEKTKVGRRIGLWEVFYRRGKALPFCERRAGGTAHSFVLRADKMRSSSFARFCRTQPDERTISMLSKRRNDDATTLLGLPKEATKQRK